MKDLRNRFERWYRQTYWMSPPLTRRDIGDYENSAVQEMYVAYRAGFNRANKENKERIEAELYQAVQGMIDAGLGQ